MSQPSREERRGGWRAFLGLLLVLGVIVGGIVGWLRLGGEPGALLSATPRVELDLPPPDATRASGGREANGPPVSAEAAPGPPRPPSQASAESVAGGAGSDRRDAAAVARAAIAPHTAPTAGVAPPRPVRWVTPAEPSPEETAPAAPGSPEPAAADAALPPWQRFAQPFPPDETRPRIAVIVAELGLSEAATREAISRLPAAVTLSFSPYGRKLQALIDAARGDGHEVLLDLPLEPVSYPRDDPGPQALLTSLSNAENQARLEWALGRATGYVGVVPWMGSRFTGSPEHMRPLLDHIKEKGLMFVDSRAASDSVGARIAEEADLPRAVNNRFLDHVPTPEAIDRRLEQIEREARTAGFAVAMGSPYPVTIRRLAEWIGTLDEKGLVLAPISAVAKRRADS